MSEPLQPGEILGIIGGGQLGRMLAMAAGRLGLRTVILDPDQNCPAAQMANDQIVAAYDDADALLRLAERCAVITYEFENVPVAAAERLAAVIDVFPPPRALEVSQDRLTEKTFLNDHGLKTAPFRSVENDGEVAVALSEFGGDAVLKTRRLGYDGKGQRLFRGASATDAEGACAAMGDVPLILEGFIRFEREISVIAARDRDGAKIAYEPAENVHRDGILRRSTVPASITHKTATAARNAAFALLDGLDYVGVVGVEFFVLGDGSLVVNEFAPRVHNSGHWTEAACSVSQFEQHVRAVAGLPLAEPRRHSDCVMENLIGDDIAHVPTLLAEPDVVVHLYGKADARPGRKMGHFTRLIGQTTSAKS